MRMLGWFESPAESQRHCKFSMPESTPACKFSAARAAL